MNPELRPADIFFTRGPGLISRLIRYFSQTFGEKRAKVNHVGVVVEAGTLERAVVVEALSRVRRHRLWSTYGPPKRDEVAVYRPIDLTPEQASAVVRAAADYVGRRYGWWKVVAHLLDWCLQGAYVFRRLARMDAYPICSWLVAHAYKKAGRNFAVDAGMAAPDDIWNYVTSHPAEYVLVRPLTRLDAGSAKAPPSPGPGPHGG